MKEIEKLSKLVEPYPITVQTAKNWKKIHPELDIWKDKNGQWYGHKGALDTFFKNNKEDFRDTVRGKMGVHRQPEQEALLEAEINLLKIARGKEPSLYWNNARHLLGDIPDEVAAAYAIGKGAPWSLAVDRANHVLNDKTGVEAKRCAERLAAFSEVL